MNWYKVSQQIHDFQDRTQVNERIRALEKIADMIAYAGKLVFQTARGSRKVIDQIIDNKKMSSFEEVQEMLRQASELALDNPFKCANICSTASKKLLYKIKGLENNRRKFVDNNVIKGLVD